MSFPRGDGCVVSTRVLIFPPSRNSSVISRNLCHAGGLGWAVGRLNSFTPGLHPTHPWFISLTNTIDFSGKPHSVCCRRSPGLPNGSHVFERKLPQPQGGETRPPGVSGEISLPPPLLSGSAVGPCPAPARGAATQPRLPALVNHSGWPRGT